MADISLGIFKTFNVKELNILCVPKFNKIGDTILLIFFFFIFLLFFPFKCFNLVTNLLIALLLFQKIGTPKINQKIWYVLKNLLLQGIFWVFGPMIELFPFSQLHNISIWEKSRYYKQMFSERNLSPEW